MLIPEGWKGAPIRDFIINILQAMNNYKNPNQRPSVTRIIVGPKGQNLNIIITSLAKNEKEPTAEETAEYFEALCYRQHLFVVNTGTIDIAENTHFWAIYKRKSLLGNNTYQLVKKYSLNLNRFEVLITASFQLTSSPEKLMNEDEIYELETVYDEIVFSISPLEGEDKFF
jgi:hypothetical protein